MPPATVCARPTIGLRRCRSWCSDWASNGAASVAELVDFELLLSDAFFRLCRRPCRRSSRASRAPVRPAAATVRCAGSAARSAVSRPPSALRWSAWRRPIAVIKIYAERWPRCALRQRARRLVDLTGWAQTGAWRDRPSGRAAAPALDGQVVTTPVSSLPASIRIATTHSWPLRCADFKPVTDCRPTRWVAKRTLAALNRTAAERVTQLELNLERLRWLPRQRGLRHIVVNIPDYSLRLIENGETVLTSRAVVGRADPSDAGTCC